jgi:2',3'-cyclic-nucleotide 2'-phosphodiesterase (5'-nucleotidase family)
MIERARKVALLAALALGAAGAAWGDGFTILQINDTYKIEGLEAGRSGGLARVRSLRRAIEEQEGRPVLVLHGGDLLFPSVMSKYLAGEAMVAALNRLDGSDDVDPRLFVTFGNHEFDHRDLGVLEARLAESRFTWLSSNLRLQRPGDAEWKPIAEALPNVERDRLLELGGVRVGLFGLTMDGDPRPWLLYDDFAGRVAAAREAVERLRRRGADLVVAVTHQELGDDVALAAAVPGIDRIVGGHEHVAIERLAGATWITKADADARTIVRIDVDREAGGLVTRHRFVLADESLPQDPAMLGEVARWLVRLEERLRETTGRGLLEVVATTEHALEGVEPVIRGRESALGNFLTDALRARLETDVALLNGGAVRVNDDVPAGGALRVYEMEGIFYYDNLPVAIELSGAELLELLRISLAGAESAHGRFLQVSGLRLRYRIEAGAGDEPRVAVDFADVEVERRGGAGWEPLDPARRYSVATLDYLWTNGCRDGYALMSAGCGGTSPPRLERPALSWRGLTEEAIAALPGRRITTAIDGRIVRVERPDLGDRR